MPDDSFQDQWQNLPPDSDTLVNLHSEVDIDIMSSDHFLHKSTRDRKRPAWWINYNTGSVKYPTTNFVSTHSFSPSHAAFMSQVVKIKEPTSFAQAVLDPKWIVAMNKELDALESNNTWVLVPLPQGKHTIGCKWVYRIKYHLMVILIVIKPSWWRKVILKLLELISMTHLHLLQRVLLSKLLLLLLLPRIGQFFN